MQLDLYCGFSKHTFKSIFLVTVTRKFQIVRPSNLSRYQLDEEAVALGPKIQQMHRRGLAAKALGRLLKFLTPEGFTREVLWRWRCLLSP